MNWPLFVRIEKQLQKNAGFNLKTSVIPKLDKRIIDKYNKKNTNDMAVLTSLAVPKIRSTFWSVTQLKKQLQNFADAILHTSVNTPTDYHLYDATTKILKEVKTATKSCSPYTTVLAQTTHIMVLHHFGGIQFRINDIKPIIITRKVMLHLLTKYNFVTAKQLENKLNKMIHTRQEPSYNNLQNKLDLSNRCIAIKSAASANAIFNVRDEHNILTKINYNHNSISILHRLNHSANTSLKSIKRTINKNCDRYNRFLKGFKLEMDMQKKFMSLSHNQLASIPSLRNVGHSPSHNKK